MVYFPIFGENKATAERILVASGHQYDSSESIRNGNGS
jgi:hypothetical protein